VLDTLGLSRIHTLGTIALAAITVFGVVVIVLSIRYPYRPQKILRRRWFWDDLVFYAIAQSFAVGFVITIFLLSVDRSFGFSRAHLVTSWPIAVQLVFFVVTHDLFMYWYHRLMHRSSFLWRFHVAGHSVEDVDFVSGLRSHPFEILVNQSIEFGAIIFLGGAVEVIVLKGLVSLAWGIWLHHNIAVRTGPLQYVINGSEMHRWHHHPEHMHVNYASKLALWDWIFGTAYNPRDKVCDRYGLDDPTFPGGWAAQFIAFFKRTPSRPPS
jgi:sterol desaturase/sphingolipid hydroxylase (fatty acid hydroxylase superfamily)